MRLYIRNLFFLCAGKMITFVSAKQQNPRSLRQLTGSLWMGQDYLLPNVVAHKKAADR